VVVDADVVVDVDGHQKIRRFPVCDNDHDHVGYGRSFQV
jgi:hypothetical protein